MNISFVVYDLAFMVVFTLAVVLFISRNRHRMYRESGMNLYKAQWGVKLIEWAAKKHRKLLLNLQGLIITIGYFLMTGILAMISYSTYLYLSKPEIVEMVKAPPIIPLIPYFGEIFNVQSFFPSSLTFTYFIIALVIVATVHEFSHGIFMRIHKIRIKSTGFAFFGPLIVEAGREWFVKSKKPSKSVTLISLVILLSAIFYKNPLILIFLVVPLLGAFVEQDDKQMKKAKKIPQLAILGAGVFANIVFALLFFILIWIFFMIAFAPAGVVFSNYALDVVPRADIVSLNNMSLDQGLLFLNISEQYASLQARNTTYYAQPAPLKHSFETNASYLLVYRDSPAFRAKLAGAITAVDGMPISSFTDLGMILSQHKPGDTIEITMLSRGAVVHTQITLAANNQGKALLGITVPDPSRAGTFLGALYSFTPKIDNALTGIHFESRLGDFGTFIFHMLWWIMTINFFVALFNMLPVSILDGGRFFYLTIAGLTGSEKAGTRAFKVITWIIVALLVIMMARWAFSIF